MHVHIGTRTPPSTCLIQLVDRTSIAFFAAPDSQKDKSSVQHFSKCAVCSNILRTRSLHRRQFSFFRVKDSQHRLLFWPCMKPSATRSNLYKLCARGQEPYEPLNIQLFLKIQAPTAPWGTPQARQYPQIVWVSSGPKDYMITRISPGYLMAQAWHPHINMSVWPFGRLPLRSNSYQICVCNVTSKP